MPRKATLTCTLGARSCPFDAWRVEAGQVFAAAYALDCETTLLDPARHWEAPAFVLGAACDGARGFFLPRDRVLPFLRAHRDVPVAFHNAPFDLRVLHRLAAEQGAGLDVYDLVERDLAWDTLLLHRLLLLATEGRSAPGRGQSTLERCAELYLGCQLHKDARDAGGNDVRTSFGRYLGRDPREIEPAYLEYLARDALATACLRDELLDRLLGVLEGSRTAKKTAAVLKTASSSRTSMPFRITASDQRTKPFVERSQ